MISMKEAEKEHCKISIGKLALRNLLFCHSGLDKPFNGCPVLDTGESSLWIYGYLLEFIPYLIRGRNDTIKNERIQIEMLTLQFAMVLERK
jgi:hypothetical protein